MAEMHDKDDLIHRASLMCYESLDNCYWQQFTFISITKSQFECSFALFQKSIESA